MSKIKIAHVLHCVGGVDIYLRLIAESINSEQFQTIVVHGLLDTDKEFLNNKNENIKSYTTSIFRDISLYYDLKAIYSTYKILKKERPNIIHCHSAKGGIIGRIVGRLLGINTIYTPHAFSYLSAENKIKRYVFLIVEKFFANGNSIVLATSKSEKNRAINEVGYNTEKAKYINNSISPINLPLKLNIVKTWPKDYICTVGRPSYQKNIEFMIEVLYLLNKSHDTHLVIMGVGHHSDKLEIVREKIRKFNLEQKVTLINWTDRENILHIISESQLYISTSRYEGMPYSVIESLALSIPCVVSGCDGNIDLIEDNYNGFVINEYDANVYSDKVLSILKDNSLRKKFSQNAHRTFIEKHNIKSIISELEKVYMNHSK